MSVLLPRMIEVRYVMKPGWQTTEFWIGIGTQLVSLLVFLGVIKGTEAGNLTTAFTGAVVAVAAFIANALVLVRYIAARTELKLDWLQQQPDPPDRPPDATASNSSVRLGLFWVAGLGLLALAGPAAAQVAQTPTAAPPHPASVLPWRQQMEERLREQGQIMAQLAANQQAILRLLERPAYPPAPPAAPPQIIVLGAPYQGAPYQQLPIAGPPRQILPIEGAPRQQLPIEGSPRQDLPLQGPPIQRLPIDGGPRQDLGPGAPKPPPAPAAPKPDPILPTPGGPLQQLAPPNPMPPAGPTGYQRYTPGSLLPRVALAR